jgi:5'-3' exonuclease
MKTTLIIDADSIAYHHAAANQQSFDFGDGVEAVQLAELANVLPEVDAEIHRYAEKLKADDVILALSCPSLECWRCDVLPSYKAHRKNVKPLLIGAIKDHWRENFKTREKPRLEADDICGILSTHPSLIEGHKIVVSIDKDLKTIPGYLFNPQKDTRERYFPAEEADYWHMYQTLVGDSTDGYKGCPGIGKTKAPNILEWPVISEPHPHCMTEMWSRVVSAFEKKKLTADDALVQARVARICRHTDYDFKTKEVKLWNPSYAGC